MSGARQDVLLGLGLAAMLSLAAWFLMRPTPTLRGVEALVQARELDAAERKVRAVLDNHPDDPDARLWLADILLERSVDSSADESLRLIREAHPTTDRQRTRALMIEGKARFRRHELRAAERAWLESLQIDPDQPPAAWALLHIYALQDRRDDARALLLGILDRVRDRREAARLLLHLLRPDAHPVDPKLAEAQLGPALAVDPDDLATVRRVALALVELHRPEEARELAENALKKSPANPEAWRLRLEVLDQAGLRKELIAAWEEVPSPIADDARLAAVRGRAAQLRGDMAEAARSYERAWTEHPDRSDLAYRYSRALMPGGPSPRLDEVHRILQAERDAQGRALSVYETALRDPAFPSARHTRELVRLLTDLQRPAEAAAWQRLVPVRPNSPD